MAKPKKAGSSAAAKKKSAKKPVKKASKRTSARTANPNAAGKPFDHYITAFLKAAGKSDSGAAGRKIAIRPIAKPARHIVKFNEALQNLPALKGFEFHDFVDCDSPVPPGTKIFCCPDRKPCDFYPKEICCP